MLTTETGLATESGLRDGECGEGLLSSSGCDVPLAATWSGPSAVPFAAFMKSSEVAARGVGVEAVNPG
jgi:hypothetical protein